MGEGEGRSLVKYTHLNIRIGRFSLPVLLCDDNGRGGGGCRCRRGLDLQPTIWFWLNDRRGLPLTSKVLDSIQPIVILRLELERGINWKERKQREGINESKKMEKEREREIKIERERERESERERPHKQQTPF